MLYTFYTWVSFAQTFSETIYKKVISGWVSFEGGIVIGKRKRLHFIFITLILWEVRRTTSKYYYFNRKQVIQNHHVLQRKSSLLLERKTHFQSPFVIQSSKGLIIRPFPTTHFARVCQVLTYIPSSLLTRLLGLVQEGFWVSWNPKPVGLNWDLRSLQSWAP